MEKNEKYNVSVEKMGLFWSDDAFIHTDIVISLDAMDLSQIPWNNKMDISVSTVFTLNIGTL